MFFNILSKLLISNLFQISLLYIHICFKFLYNSFNSSILVSFNFLTNFNKAKKDTSIELKIEHLLNELGIRYEKQYRISKWVFDFYLTDFNFVIECQGDYWHANPLIFKENKLNEVQLKNINRDKRKKDFIEEHKIESLFLWESDINKNIESIKNMLITLFVNM